MIRNLNYQNQKNTLYLIPTPIGNLDDITYRALKTLEEVDFLYAEDTRVTKKLLSHFKIDKLVISLHEHNEMKRFDEVIEKLQSGKDVGLVSDAGMPLLSDPGLLIVNEVIKSGFNVVSLPGANALLPGLLMSGFKTIPFVFIGFLDSKVNKRKSELERIKYYPETLVFYEAIHRFESTLESMYEVFGDREFVIAREISKTYEEIIRGSLSEYNSIGDLKGELVIIVKGYEEKYETNLSIVEQVDYFINSGMKKTEAMKKVSEMTNIPKNKIYQDYLERKIKED
ncbi:MAG: 16S rRNA (cytidine(1402)-2'-O)-methyltransferase [Candidatus Izemoplasmatales bacterium]|nr:16S rRNA (cytidine(1402)-2'-O)-methyltransferase [Candidatus Izemoplasmatales bacterium]